MISKQLKIGFEALKEHPAEIVFGLVLSGFISLFTFGILLGPMLVGYNHMLHRFKKGEPSGMSEMFEVAFSDMTTPLLAISMPTILLNIVVIPLSLLLPTFLSFPLYFIWPAFMILYLAWAGPVFACERFEDWTEGVKKTWEFGTGSSDHLLMAIIMLIFSDLGVILCGIGVFITSSIASYALLSTYVDETSGTDDQDQKDEDSEKDTDEDEDDEEKEKEKEKKDTEEKEKAGSPAADAKDTSSDDTQTKEKDTQDKEEDTETGSEDDKNDTEEKEEEEEEEEKEKNGEEDKKSEES